MFWVIGNSKKVPFSKKSVFIFFFIKQFLHTFFAKTELFATPTTFFKSLINHKRFIFEESYIWYGKRQKSCTLIVIQVKCLYLMPLIFLFVIKVKPEIFIAKEEVHNNY